MPVSTEAGQPRRSLVQIHEVDSELLSNVRIASIKRPTRVDDSIDGWPTTYFTTPTENQWKEPNYFIFSFEASVIKNDDGTVNDHVWMPFSSQDVDNVQLLSTERLPGGKKFQKVVSRFGIRLEATDKQIVPYVQFYCCPKVVKYYGSVYHRGDIITLVVKHPQYPIHWPNQPLVTVKPVAPTTYVPLLSKQRLCLVTDLAQQSVEYKTFAGATVKLVGSIEADYGHECTIFHCAKATSTSEVVKVSQKSKKNKTVRNVVIPATEKDPRCPVILNPTEDSLIYGSNVDGLIVRFSKADCLPVVVMDPTPIRCVRTVENHPHFERRFIVDRRRPFIHLKKRPDAWVIS